MHGLKQDIDGRRAKPWKKKAFSLKSENAGAVETKVQLFNSIKRSIVKFANAMYGDSSD